MHANVSCFLVSVLTFIPQRFSITYCLVRSGGQLVSILEIPTLFYTNLTVSKSLAYPIINPSISYAKSEPILYKSDYTNSKPILYKNVRVSYTNSKSILYKMQAYPIQNESLYYTNLTILNPRVSYTKSKRIVWQIRQYPIQNCKFLFNSIFVYF